MTQFFHDPFARTTVLGSHTDTATAIFVKAGEGTRFPDAPRQLVMWDATLWDNPVQAFYGEGSPVEIITQSDPGVSNQLPTVIRGERGTTALDMTDTTHTFEIQAFQSDLIVALDANLGTLTVTVGGIIVEEGDVTVELGGITIEDTGGNLTLTDGAFDGNLLEFGTDQWLWVDTSGRLRIKTSGGVPSSDTDGVVVGTQT